MSAAANGALLAVQELRTWFPIKSGVFRRTVGHVRAVDGVDLAVARGRTLALVGESGCGKTTVGRSILRLVEPQAGRVVFDGADLLRLPHAELRPYRRRLQIVTFVDTGTVAPALRAFQINDLQTSVGAGVRYRGFRVEYAHGAEGGRVHLGVGMGF